MRGIYESDVEEAALKWLDELGWSALHCPDIGPDGEAAECAGYGQVALEQRLRDGLARLNPALPAEALDDTFRRITRPEGPTLEARNRAIHRVLVDGATVE